MQLEVGRDLTTHRAHVEEYTSRAGLVILSLRITYSDMLRVF